MGSRWALVCAALLVVTGCDSGTVVIEIDLPPAAGEVVQVQVAGAGVAVERSLAVDTTTVPLTASTQHLCITAHGPAGEVNVRLRQCENESCTGAADTVPRAHTATIEQAIYAGKTTNVRLGAFRVDGHVPVARCDVRGCTDRFTSTFCSLEDGAHFCEGSGSVEPTPECDVQLEVTIP